MKTDLEGVPGHLVTDSDLQPARPGLAAVIVSYRSERTIAACVTGMLASGVDKVVVVDNSPDAEVQRVLDEVARQARPGTVRCVRPSANVGFGRGVNLGVRVLGRCDWLVVANADVLIDRPLHRLVEMAEPRGAAIVAGCLDPDSHNFRPRTTAWRELARAGVGDRRSRLYLQSVPREGESRRVHQLDGALMVMSADVFRALGGFDESFELYYEDVDLCRRAEALGGCLLLGETVGHHIGGASSSANRAAAFATLRISRLRFAKKHWGRAGLAIVVLAAVVEFLTRTAARCPEGAGVRFAALRHQLRELRAPGSVWLLEHRSAELPGEVDRGT